MVQILPRDALVSEVSVGDSLCDLLVGSTNLLRQLLDSAFRQDAGPVHVENAWSLELSVDDSVANDLLHHFPLGGVSITSTHEVGVLNLGKLWALLVVGAAVSLGYSLVRSALFSYEVPVLAEVTVEEWPSSIAAFVQVVACHQELRRQKGNLSAVLKLQALLGDLSKAHSVAGAAVSLVSMLVSEVKALDVSPVEVSWQLVVWDLVCRRILLLEVSCLFESSLEGSSLTELSIAGGSFICGLCFIFVFFGLSLGKNLRLAVTSIVGVVLLVFASIGLPSKVERVDSVN